MHEHMHMHAYTCVHTHTHTYTETPAYPLKKETSGVVPLQAHPPLHWLKQLLDPLMLPDSLLAAELTGQTLGVHLEPRALLWTELRATLQVLVTWSNRLTLCISAVCPCLLWFGSRPLTLYNWLFTWSRRPLPNGTKLQFTGLALHDHHGCRSSRWWRWKCAVLPGAAQDYRAIWSKYIERHRYLW